MKKNRTIWIISISGMIIIAILIYLIIDNYQIIANTISDMINPTLKKYSVTSPFGYRTSPTTGASTYHNGIDIAAPSGTDVLSPEDGTVILCNTTTSGGKQLRVKHTNGIVTGYAHLSQQLVSLGDVVTKGQVIAKTGNTGIGTGAHLHLTCEVAGVKVDPLKYFYQV